MNLPIRELLFTGLLAGGFAAAGELVLRRSSRNLAEANEALLVGMGLLAALLFPLSLILPGHALGVELSLMAAALLGAIWVRRARSGRPAVANPKPRGARDRVLLATFAGIVAVAFVFAALNFRFQSHWDGFQIWASKAQRLFVLGGLTPDWYAGDIYDRRVLDYPPLVPMIEALLSVLRGGFDFERLKPVFLLFYLSLLVGTYSAARALVSERLSAFATLLVALLPPLSTGFSAGGYADMPQAAIVAAATGACLSGRGEAAAWLIGALTTVKSEGTILAALACFGVVLDRLLESPRALWRFVRTEVRAIAVVALFFGIRLAYLRWIAFPDPCFQWDVPEAVRRVRHVARLSAVELLRPRHWALFWPAFLAGAAVAVVRGTHREKALAACVALGLVVAAVPFLFTNWPVDLHFAQAYFRLAAQLAPAAGVVIVAGYSRLAEPVPAGP